MHEFHEYLSKNNLLPEETKSVKAPENEDKPAANSLQYVEDQGIWVGNVLENSPACEAGFNIGDKLLEIDGEAVSSIQKVKERLESGITNSMVVKILRKSMFGTDETLSLEFKPREWQGQGFTGFALKSTSIF